MISLNLIFTVLEEGLKNDGFFSHDQPGIFAHPSHAERSDSNQLTQGTERIPMSMERLALVPSAVGEPRGRIANEIRGQFVTD